MDMSKSEALAATPCMSSTRGNPSTDLDTIAGDALQRVAVLEQRPAQRIRLEPRRRYLADTRVLLMVCLHPEHQALVTHAHHPVCVLLQVGHYIREVDDSLDEILVQRHGANQGAYEWRHAVEGFRLGLD